MVLETATVVTPFASYYRLTGKWDVIAIAYAAHVPYGLLLGWMTARPLARKKQLDEIGPWVVPAALVGLLVVLLAWQRPWSASPADAVVRPRVRPVHPRWVRIPAGTCVPVRNSGDDDLTVTGGPTIPVPAGGSVAVCVDALGVTASASLGGPGPAGMSYPTRNCRPAGATVRHDRVRRHAPGPADGPRGLGAARPGRARGRPAGPAAGGAARAHLGPVGGGSCSNGWSCWVDADPSSRSRRKRNQPPR